jgi:ABC-type nitrate/sulfonate/bicarbonate transport system ATPase subunit
VLERVSRTFRGRGGADVHALDRVSLRARAGELVAVVGPSGCGKSTLLELVCGLQAADSGTVACAPAVLMPQRDLLLPWLSALDNAALALRIAGHSRAQARAHAAATFADLGLDGFEGARPHELSGGMRQRVAFLRTLLAGKPVLCLDEPFGALDALTRSEMQDWLARTLAQEQAGSLSRTTPPSRTTQPSRTVLLVTHDVEEAALLADRVVVLSARPGRVLAQFDVEIPRARSHDSRVDAVGRGRVRTDPDVVALRERALAALESGARR